MKRRGLWVIATGGECNFTPTCAEALPRQRSRRPEAHDPYPARVSDLCRPGRSQSVRRPRSGHYLLNDLPKNITGSSTPTIESKININNGGIVSDVNINQIKGYHEFFGELEAKLISPQGTEVILFKNKCGNYNGYFNFGIDDDAPELSA